MKQITQIGATVEEAISLALQKLGQTPDQVEVEVLQEGKKGFLGFGSKPAEVKVTVKENATEQSAKDANSEKMAIVDEPIIENNVNEVPGEEPALEREIQPNQHDKIQVDPVEETKHYIAEIARSMGIEDLKIEQVLEGKYVSLKLQSKDAARLIGKRGQTLNSIQQLAQLILNKNSKTFLMLQVDVENYRERRQESLEQLAERMADKAVRLGETHKFEPMPSYERKIIHNALANRLDIETYSEGEDPHRYLVIEPLK